MRNKGSYQNGQILLIALMTMVVAMVIGLSIATRTITTLRMTTAEDNSSRAFSAAEAGIEQALTGTVNSTPVLLTNNSSYTTSKSQLSGNEILINNGNFVPKDDSADIWLIPYPDYTIPWPTTGTSNLNIYWGASSDVCNTSEITNTMAALEIIIISGSKASPVLNTYAFDPCASRASVNKFCPNNTSCPAMGGSATVAGKNFAYSASIPVSSGLLARAIPLYAGTYIGAKGPPDLPSQGTTITSIGSSGGTQRKVVSFQGFPKVPAELFQYIIFSPK